MYMLQTFASKLNSPKIEQIPQDTGGNDRILRSQVPKEEQKKDLTAVVNMLQKKQVESLQTKREQLYLETVQSNSSAVYQTIESMVSDQNQTELMKGQVVFTTNYNSCKRKVKLVEKILI